VAANGGTVRDPARRRRFFADLHVHSNASFDSLASPASLVRTAA
jgi:hypothetical protein